jgi:hypothetical protein
MDVRFVESRVGFLKANGFVDIRSVDVTTSAIPGWDQIGLDVRSMIGALTSRGLCR